MQVRAAGGAPLGVVFSFLSGLYFRGKLEYATRFARPPAGMDGVQVITPSRGLVSARLPVTLEVLREFADVPIDPGNEEYRLPLERACRALERTAPDARFVLLGSVATGKYVDILSAVFGERLWFPQAFVGRGDMSRGGLLLRSADLGRELEYVPIDGAVRRGSRPPRLTPRRRQALRTPSAEG